jgi:hypothetical protein
MQHNPEKYLSPEQRRQDWISRLVEEKAISLLRLGSDAEDAGRKKATYARLRQINEQLFRCIAADLVPSLQDAGRRRSTAISPGAFDTREFFFGLFPTERLEAVAAGAGAPDEGLPDDEVADNIGPPAPRDCERATFSR